MNNDYLQNTIGYGLPKPLTELTSQEIKSLIALGGDNINTLELELAELRYRQTLLYKSLEQLNNDK